jgi:cell division control protein 6
MVELRGADTDHSQPRMPMTDDSAITTSKTVDQDNQSEGDSDNPFERFTSAGVFESPDTLRDVYTPDDLKHRDEEIDKLVFRLGPALENDRPGHVLLSGPNGSGKTEVSKYISRKFLQMPHEDQEVATLHVNCGSAETEYAVVEQLINTVRREEAVGRGYSVNDLIKMACDEISQLGDTVLLTLDEVGQIPEMNTFLYQISRQKQEGTHLTDTGVGVIFTGNEFRFTQNFSGAVESSFDKSKVVFEPYSADELRDILSHRADQAFTDQGIEDAAVQLAAAFAAQNGGDARYGLQMLLEAGEHALEVGEAPVNEQHVRVGKRRRDEDRVGESLSTLTANAQLAVFSILSLKQQGKEDPIGSEIIEEYNRIGQNFLNTKSQNSIYTYLSDLDQLNFINKIETANGSTKHQVRFPEQAILKKINSGLRDNLTDSGFLEENSDGSEEYQIETHPDR